MARLLRFRGARARLCSMRPRVAWTPGMSFDWNNIPLLLKLADTGSMSQTGRLLGAWSRSQAWICSGVEGIHNCWSIRADGAVHHPGPRHDHKMTRRVT